MSKKFTSCLFILLLLGVGAFLIWQRERGASSESSLTPISVKSSGDEPHFVTEVDPDVSHWQTKETKFFSIKFPKEWYWVESDLEKTGYRSQVITNNPQFPIERFADIGIFTGTSYRFTNNNNIGQSLSIPLKNTEIVISTIGWATTNAGTPHDFLEAKLASVRGMLLHNTDCQYTSTIETSPLTAYCVFEEDHQRVETIYIAYPDTTYALTARTTEDTTVPRDILEKIAKSITVND